MALTDTEKIEFVNSDEVKRVAQEVAAVQMAFNQSLQKLLDENVPVKRLKGLVFCTTNRLQNEVRTLNDGNGACPQNQRWDEELQQCVPITALPD